MFGFGPLSAFTLGGSTPLGSAGTSATYGVATYDNSLYGTVFDNESSGSYTLTGNAASFRYDYNLTSVAGSYSITGQAAQTITSRLLTGDSGSYSITGGAATLIHNDVLYAGYFQFTWTGNDATLTSSRVLTSAAGSYTLTGSDATLIKDYVATAEAGSYDLSGKDATFDYHQLNVQSTGGIPKKVKTKIKKSQREEVEAAVREAFDKMDGTYVPPKVVAEIQKEVKKEIKQIDLGQYDVAMAQINALLLTAKLKIHEYESEIDDEESLLMLL